MFFIVGAHRSGTSAVSQAAAILGADLGSTADMIGASDSNIHGHWENRSLVRINEALLQRLGGTWRELPRLTPGWELDDSLDGLRDHARKTIAELFTDSPAAFKDPRTSLLLPFWRTVANVEGTVVVIRHPASVARSLAQRNQIPEAEAADMWTTHTLSAWQQPGSRLAIHYENLVRDPVAVCTELGEFLGLPKPDDKTIAELKSAIEMVDLEPPRPHGVEEAMGLALVLHRILTNDCDQFPPLASAILASWESDWRRVEAVERLERSLATARRDLVEARAEAQLVASTAAEARSTLEAAVVELARTHDAMALKLARTRSTLARRDSAYDRLRSRLSVRVALRVARLFKPIVRLLRRRPDSP